MMERIDWSKRFELSTLIKETKMKKTKLKVITVAVCLMLSAIVANGAEDKVVLEGAKVGQWTMDYAAALAEAKKSELPVLLNFTGSDWCGWCKIMDKNVFSKKEWQEYAAKNMMLVTLDFPKDKSIVPEKYVSRNDKLSLEFGVEGYPTYIVLDYDGQTRLGQLGAGREKTGGSFIGEVKSALKTSQNSLKAYAIAHPDKIEAFKATIQALKSNKKALDDWIQTRPSVNPENKTKYANFLEDIKTSEEALSKF